MIKQELIETDLSLIHKLCTNVLASSYKTIKRMGGLTNHTYHVTMDNGDEWAIRIPGEGTEELIIRKNEKVSTELACRLGIDSELLYFSEDGFKITKYIPDAITMSPSELQTDERIKQIASIFRTLHTCGTDTQIAFDVFDMAETYEKVIYDAHVPMYEDYSDIKQKVFNIKKIIDTLCAPTKVPCHNDSLCENWVSDGTGRLYLIDWEYAGMNDGMWDLADVSIEAHYTHDTETKLLTHYFERELSTNDQKHFLANKIYVDFLWTLWAKARVPYDGQSMEDWATERYMRMKENINAFQRYH